MTSVNYWEMNLREVINYGLMLSTLTDQRKVRAKQASYGDRETLALVVEGAQRGQSYDEIAETLTAVYGREVLMTEIPGLIAAACAEGFGR